MLMRMFPPFPIPGFVPDFTGSKFNSSWYEMQKFIAQSPEQAIAMVSNSDISQNDSVKCMLNL